MKDGIHGSIRWYARQVFGYAAPLVTIDGHDGNAYVHRTQEMADTSPAAIGAWIDQVLAENRAKREKRAQSRATAPIAEVPPKPAAHKPAEAPVQGALL